MARANRHHIPGRVWHITLTCLVYRACAEFQTPSNFPSSFGSGFKRHSSGQNQRESWWTESIAVGGIGFVQETKSRLGIMGMGRRIEAQEADRCVLREEFEPYSAVFDPESGRLSPNNRYFWDVLCADSIGWFGPTLSNLSK